MTTHLTPHDSTHESLLHRLANHANQSTWDEFYSRYGRLIGGFCRLANRYNLDIEELIQEVYVALTKSLPKFQYNKAKGKFRDYLKRVTTNKAMELSRKRGKRPGSLDQNLAGEIKDDKELDDIWEDQWNLYLLEQSFLQLAREYPAKRIDLFRRYAIEDVPVDEVAKEFDCSQAMVYKLKSIMSVRLREIINKIIEEEG